METQLKTTLTLNNGQFVAACDEGQARTGKFQDAVGGGTGNFVKFNTHMLESRRTMRLLGDAAGHNLGEITKFVHAFGMFGPIAGAAVAGFILLQDHIKHTAEKLKEATDQENKFNEAMRGLRMEADHLEFNRAAKSAHELGKEVTAITTKMLEIQQGSAWEEIAIKLTSGPMYSAVMKDAEKSRMASAEYKQLQAELERAKGEYQHQLDKNGGPGTTTKGGEHGGTGAAHIGKAMYGSELGAYKLEHTDPTVALLKESVEVQKVIAAAVVSRTSATPFKDLTKLDYASDF